MTSAAEGGSVTAALVAALDPDGDARVLKRRRVLADAGLVASLPRHRPHLTLGAVRVGRDALPQIVGLAEGVADGMPVFRLSLEHLGSFPRGGVLWLGPAPSASLRLLQSRTDTALAAAGHARAFGAQTEPERWIPHCTLATRLTPEKLGQAVTLLAGGHSVIHTRVTAIATFLVGGSGDAAVAPLRG